MKFYANTTQDLISAMNNSNVDIIYLRPNYTYTLTTVEDTDTYGKTGLPKITRDLTIIGQGSIIARAPSAPSFRIFHIGNNHDVKLQGLTITNGKLAGTNNRGAGIYNAGGNLTLVGCAVANHTNDTVNNNTLYGVGICNLLGATLHMQNCMLINNHANDSSGLGIYNDATVVLENSRISNNSGESSVQGGGIWSAGINANIQISRCNIYGNQASDGGALRGNGKWLVTESDIYNNRAGGAIGGACYFLNDSSVFDITLRQNRIYNNRTSSGLSNITVVNPFTSKDIDAKQNYWGADDGPSGVASGSGESISTYIEYEPFLTSDECIQEGVNSCELGWAANDTAQTGNPVSLRLGEKRLQETDLRINTPGAPLNFTRYYRQDKQDEFQFMGLGWTHNHAMPLAVSGSSPTREITIQLPNGGGFLLRETYTNLFQAEGGSEATLTYDGTGDKYTLTDHHQTVYVFESTAVSTVYKLKSRTWENGDYWDYDYSSDQLTSVTAGTRTLTFSYATQFGFEVLSSVTDHSGRSVSFSYSEQKEDGAVVEVTTGKSLAMLTDVTDLRGNDWSYSYYGAEIDEDDVDLLDRMLTRTSPNIGGSPITLEKLTYLKDQQIDLAVNGTMKQNTNWFPIMGLEADVNEQSTGQVYSGNYSRYVEADIDTGIEGEHWHLIAGKQYTISAQVYVVTGSVKMQVNDETTTHSDTTTTSGSWEQLDLTISPSTSVYNRRLEFIGASSSNEFYVDSVTIIEENPDVSGLQQERGIIGTDPALLDTSLVFAPHQSLTAETIDQKVTTHQFDRGLYAGSNNPLGATNAQLPNGQFRTNQQEDANGNVTSLLWNKSGRQLEQVTDPVGNQTSFNYYAEDTLQNSIDAEGNKTIYAYEDTATGRQPTLILTTRGEIDVNGEMETDSDWSGVNSPSTNIHTPKADSGHYLRRVKASTSAKGIESTTWDLTSSIEYIITARVYIMSGAVKMKVTGTSDFDKVSSVTEIWHTMEVRHTPSATQTNRNLQFETNASNTEFYIDTVSISKAGEELAVNGNMELDSDWTDISGRVPNKNEHIVGAISGDYARRVVANQSGKGIQSIQLDLEADHNYVIVARVYPVNSGDVVKMAVSGISGFEQLSSSYGSWETLKISQKVTSAGSHHLQFLANSTSAEFYVDSVVVLDQTHILRWQEFSYNSAGRTVEQKLIDPQDHTISLQKTTQEYYTSGDSVGLLKKVIQEEIGGMNDVTTTYTYDNLGRLIKTHKSSNFGNCEFSYTVYDDADNVVASICNYDPDYPTGYPTLVPTTASEATSLHQRIHTEYAANPSTFTPDFTKNKVTTHTYDVLGRRTMTTLNAGNSDAEKTSLTVYDGLGRIQRTVSNYTVQGSSDPAEWVWREVSGTWAWRLSDTVDTIVNHGTDNDQNIIADTSYNARGLVMQTRNVLGLASHQIYDDAGRLIRTIGNYVAQGSSDPAEWVWREVSGTGTWRLSDTVDTIVNHGTNNNQNILTDQVYDLVGNVVKTMDTLGNVTFMVYDPLNRPVRTIRSAGNPGYDILNDPGLNAYTLSDKPDEDLTSETLYDAMGRTFETRQLIENRGNTPDELWTTTRHIYNELGQQIRTIRNYVVQGSSDPADWVWRDSSPATGVFAWRLSDTDDTLVNHGTNNDQNIITETEYDNAGRVKKSLDLLRNETMHIYDGFGRQTRTIGNYVAQGSSDPADWVWREVSGTWAWRLSDTDDTLVNYGVNNDQNIITDTEYDANGNVASTRDVQGRVTLNVYDDNQNGRRLKTISNYVEQGSSLAVDWVWVNDHWEDGSSNNIDHGTNEDLNRITETIYDFFGRVQASRDSQGNQNYAVYDDEGSQVKQVSQYLAQSTTPDEWTWREVSGTWAWRLSDTNDTVVSRGSVKDQNTISENGETDIAGRLIQSRDPFGVYTHNVYDKLGRRVLTVSNYTASSDPATWFWDDANQQWEDSTGAIDHGVNADENLVTYTTYNPAGQVIATRNVQGMVTSTTYDKAGRRLQTTQADGTYQSSTSYTCYDKSGRVLRTIQNWSDEGDPDAQDTNGDWTFSPDYHGVNNDENLITRYKYDLTGRRIKTVNPSGDVVQMTHFLGGQMKSTTQVSVAVNDTLEDVTTEYRYDALRRRRMVVQAFQDVSASYQDISKWEWTNNRWEDGDSTIIAHHDGVHTTNLDRNIVVRVDYNTLGQMTAMRKPNGTQDVFRYDELGRRIIKVSNYTSQGSSDPIDWEWANNRWEDGAGNPISHDSNSPTNVNDQNIITQTTYSTFAETSEDSRKSRTTIRQPDGTEIVRDFDRLSRVEGIAYNDLANTPDVDFLYDELGNRQKMIETGASGTVRETHFAYDTARRLISVGFDTDGDTVVDDTVAYSYNEVGQRTKMTLPSNLDVVYQYDTRGRLSTLTDWDNQETTFGYDGVGRNILTERDNGFKSLYQHDPAGRLQQLRHTAGEDVLGHFAYQVDARGNRTQATELLAHPATTDDITIPYDDAIISYNGSWADDIVDASNKFKKTEKFSASMKLVFVGKSATLTVGTGINHSLFDVYIGGSLWESFDGFEDTTDETSSRDINIQLAHAGPHTLEIRNRVRHSLMAKAHASYDKGTFTVRFKQLVIADTAYDFHTIEYNYDAVSRLHEARYNRYELTEQANADLLRRYQYNYDVAGNRLTNQAWVNNVLDTDLNYTYNGLNQLLSDGTVNYTYTINGNLQSDGTNTYTWDRANRQITAPGSTSYAYDGLGNRLQKTVSSVVTDYLLDIQPGLTKVLAQTTSGNTDRFVHGMRGIHAMEDNSGDWSYLMQDGLGSVRAEVDPNNAVLAMQNYTPYGDPFGANGTFGSDFGFTGEQTDGNGQVFLRARYYNPHMGVFTALDPLETLNRYNYVRSNPINRIDPTGLFDWETRTVEQGDWLWCIAREGTAGWTGLQPPPNIAVNQTVNILRSMNNLPNPSLIYSGQQLNMPTNVQDIGLQNANKSCHPSRIIVPDTSTIIISDCPPEIPQEPEVPLGQPNTGGACCGPDVTRWFASEIVRHGLYAFREGDIQNTSPIDGILSALGNENLNHLAVYGLAVDYGFVPYRDLAITSAYAEGNNYIPSEDSYTSGCGNAVVTLCGECRNATDLGNFMLGFVIRLSGWPIEIAFAATSFNLYGGVDESIIADTEGLLAGYNFPDSVAAIGDDLCQSLNVLGTGWYDEVNPVCNTPCSAENLNCAQNSTPNWRTYVSANLGLSRNPRTPVERFNDLAQGILVVD